MFSSEGSLKLLFLLTIPIVNLCIAITLKIKNNFEAINHIRKNRFNKNTEKLEKIKCLMKVDRPHQNNQIITQVEIQIIC